VERGRREGVVAGEGQGAGVLVVGRQVGDPGGRRGPGRRRRGARRQEAGAGPRRRHQHLLGVVVEGGDAGEGEPRHADGDGERRLRAGRHGDREELNDSTGSRKLFPPEQRKRPILRERNTTAPSRVD